MFCACRRERGREDAGIVSDPSPVDDVLRVQVRESGRDLGRVEDGAHLVEAGLAHVVDVELQVAAVHDGEDEAERLLRLERVRQAHLRRGEGTADRTRPGSPDTRGGPGGYLISLVSYKVEQRPGPTLAYNTGRWKLHPRAVS